MKNIDKTSLIISLVALVAAFSIISIIAAPTEVRFSWQGINPWNTVRAVPLMFKRFMTSTTESSTQYPCYLSPTCGGECTP